MATRTTYPGGTDAQVGDVLTETLLSSLPGGWVGYVAITSAQASITTETDVTGLTLTFTALASRKYRVTADVGIFSSVADDGCGIFICDGSSTHLQEAKVLTRTNVFATRLAAHYIVAPAAGSTTYKVRAARVDGSGSVTLYAAAAAPSYLLIEDIGASS